MTERVLMKGNEAIAEAAIKAGCRHFFGYPITPQNELAAYMAKRMPQKDVSGVFLQAESEVAAINMVLGAAAAGVRVMTSSSSPGVALKGEGISYLIGSDLPCVIINIQRGGPGLGGIQPSQADYNMSTKAPGHGDGRMLVFAPSTVQEMVDTVFTVYELAEKYRMPAMLLCDGLLGQMMEPVAFPEDTDINISEKPWAVNGHKNQRPKNIVNSLYLQAPILEKVVKERYKRYAEIEANETRAESYLTEDAETLIVAYGASARVCRSAVVTAREQGMKVGLLRPITLWPFPKKEILEASKNAKNILVVEMSMGQMIDDVKLAVEFKMPVHFFGHTGGVVPTPAEVLAQLKEIGGAAI